MSFAEDLVEDPEWMTHDEVIDTAMDLWNYIAVCEFFLMAIRASAVSVNGEAAQRYPFERGLEIVALFLQDLAGVPGRNLPHGSRPRRLGPDDGKLGPFGGEFRR